MRMRAAMLSQGDAGTVRPSRKDRGPCRRRRRARRRDRAMTAAGSAMRPARASPNGPTRPGTAAGAGRWKAMHERPAIGGTLRATS